MKVARGVAVLGEEAKKIRAILHAACTLRQRKETRRLMSENNRYLHKCLYHMDFLFI